MSGDDSSLSKESLNEVRDNSLEENYEPHDVAQGWFVSTMERRGWGVSDHGMDDRHADEAKYGYGPDLVIYPPMENDYEDMVFPQPCGYVEIKSKRLDSSGDDWYGCLNSRHLTEYVEHDEEMDVPTYLYMTVVDEDRGIVVRDGFFRVSDHDVDHTRYSHGNDVVCLDKNNERNLQFAIADFLDHQ